MTKKPIFCAIFMFAMSCTPAALAAAPSFLVAESSGAGASRAEALIDARRSAVQAAIGFVSKGMTQAVDGGIKEKIVQLSRAFIEKYEITKETQDKGKYFVSIKAWIRKESLIEGLTRYDPDRSAIDGTSLFAKSATREQQIREAADMLEECFNSIPIANYIHCAAIGDNFSVREGKLDLEVRFSFDKDLYFSVLAPQFVTVLDYIAEAGLKDVPMAFDIVPGEAVPPEKIASFSAYADLMEITDGNRYIDLPGVGGYANIYVMTRNYYFNCYRVPSESFAALMKSVLETDRRGRLSGGVFSEASLILAFRNKGGQKIAEHREPINMTNAMVFANTGGFKRAAYDPKNGGEPDEQNHSIFIMPFVGVYSNDKADYALVENDVAKLQIPLKANELKLIDSIECEIEAK
jgi:hypothetical protein